MKALKTGDMCRVSNRRGLWDKVTNGAERVGVVGKADMLLVIAVRRDEIYLDGMYTFVLVSDGALGWISGELQVVSSS